MVKNIMVLAFVSWVCIAHAVHPVAQEHMGDAEKYRVERSVTEQEAQRAVAGEGPKKTQKSPEKKEAKDLDSEIQYWQFSEE